MPIPSRSPHGGLYCIHGTFPDHCQICVCDYVAGLEQQLRDERARVKVLREGLDELDRFSFSIPGYHGSPTEIKVRAALAATAPEEQS